MSRVRIARQQVEPQNEVPEAPETLLDTSEGEVPTVRLSKPHIPPPPASVLQPDKAEAFWAWLASIPNEAWTRMVVYIYRNYPQVNFQVREDGTVDTTLPKHAEKLGEKFNREDLFEMQGSGEYMIIVHETDNPHALCKAFVRLQDLKRPPKKILLHQLDREARVNQPYVRQLVGEGKLTPDGKIPEAKGQEQAPTTDAGMAIKLLAKELEDTRKLLFAQMGQREDQTTSKALEILTDAYKQGNKAIMETRSGVAPDLAPTFALIEKVVNMIKPGSEGAPMKEYYERLLTMEQEHRKRELELLTQLVQAKGERPSEPGLLDQLAKFKEAREGLSALFGGGEGASERSTLEVVLGHVSPLIDKGLTALNLFLAGKQSPQPGLANLANQPQTHPALPPGQSLTPDATQLGPDAATQQLRAAVIEKAPLVLQMLNMGKDGYDLANAVESFAGLIAYQQIASLGPEGILEALKASPVWQQLAPIEDRVKLTVAEFLDYGEPGEPEEEPTKKVGPKAGKKVVQ